MEKEDSNMLKEVITFISLSYYLDPTSISGSDRLEEDLTITGDEAWDFFAEYSEKFHVDISNFLMYDYFKPEGLALFPPILEILGLRKKTVKKTFTVSDLVKGIEAGRLDEEVLNKK